MLCKHSREVQLLAIAVLRRILDTFVSRTMQLGPTSGGRGHVGLAVGLGGHRGAAWTAHRGTRNHRITVSPSLCAPWLSSEPGGWERKVGACMMMEGLGPLSGYQLPAQRQPDELSTCLIIKHQSLPWHVPAHQVGLRPSRRCAALCGARPAGRPVAEGATTMLPLGNGGQRRGVALCGLLCRCRRPSPTPPPPTCVSWQLIR